MDANGDGVADGAYADGVDTYLMGQVDFTSRLRTALGPTRVLAVDGSGRQRPDASAVGGIEEEGFPRADDPNLARWSTGLCALNYWTSKGAGRRLSYPLAKTDRAASDPVSFSRFRVALGAALLSGSQFAYWDEPGGSSLDGLRMPPDSGIFKNAFTVWDELVGGVDATPGWLGMPISQALYVADDSPDLLAGKGCRLPSAWVSRISTTRVTLTRLNPAALRLDPVDDGGFSLRFVVNQFPGGDLVVALDAAVDADCSLPATIGRPVAIYMASGGVRVVHNYTISSPYFPLRSYAQALPAGPVTVNISFAGGVTSSYLRNIRVYAAADTAYRLFEGGAVFVNPSGQPAEASTSSD